MSLLKFGTAFVYGVAILDLTTGPASAGDGISCEPDEKIVVCAAKKSSENMVVLGLGTSDDKQEISSIIETFNDSGRNIEFMFVDHSTSRGVILFANLGPVGQIKIDDDDYRNQLTDALERAYNRFYP